MKAVADAFVRFSRAVEVILADNPQRVAAVSAFNKPGEPGARAGLSSF